MKERQSKKLSFAIVGCGRIFQKYAEIFQAGKIKNGEIATVCDIQVDRARKAGKKLAVPYYQDMDKMMKSEVPIDIVCVLTPSGVHAQHAIRLTKYRSHILIEKPMALTIESAEKILAAVKKNRIRIFTVKQNRFNIPIIKLKEALTEKAFGKIFLATARIRWSRDQKYYNTDFWRGTWKLDGGVFANQACHHIDLIQMILGQPISVFAKGQRSLSKTETEDTGVVVIKFKNNAIGIVEATTAARPKDLEGSISVLGEAGSVEIGGFAANEIKVWDFSNQKYNYKNLAKFSQNPPNVYGFGHIEFLNKMIESIRTDRKFETEGKEGLKTVKLISAIYESMAANKEIYLDKNFKQKKSKLGRG